MSDDRTYLRVLATRYPNVDAALNRIAELTALLGLPAGTIHVVSDVHGEHKKLRHIINNASGEVRELIERTFQDRITAEEKLELQKLVYYPREYCEHLRPTLTTDRDRAAFVERAVGRAAELLRTLAQDHTLGELDAIIPPGYAATFAELLRDRGDPRAHVAALASRFVAHDREIELLRHLAHAIRNLLISELIVAGDLGDRGPRLDKVLDYLMRQPNVSITWGNHDACWIAACFGHRASIATVLRLSTRYRRLSQLEEGYGITMAPLEHLARTVYDGDPATRFQCKGTGLRDALLMARMQKAIAVIQFKLEGQLIQRNPELAMGHRRLLAAVDPETRTVLVDGKRHPLLDSHFPTIDWSRPEALSDEETHCIERLRESFLHSPVLWQHMSWLVEQGSTWLRRGNNLVFHGCVPVTAGGAFEEMTIDGRAVKGRALLDAWNVVVARAHRKRAEKDLDLLWYLWTGPRSPSFGKDRMTTFENYLVADPATHKETKNPYFKLIHDADFCRHVFAELGVEKDHGVIVNGHVPVRLEKGESPIKDSKLAVTIDGAFSEAYGDRGYTLVIEPARIFLAQHHHFESVEDAILRGADIVPTITDVAVFDRPKTHADNERGEEIRQEIAGLERLIEAFEANTIRER